MKRIWQQKWTSPAKLTGWARGALNQSCSQEADGNAGAAADSHRRPAGRTTIICALHQWDLYGRVAKRKQGDTAKEEERFTFQDPRRPQCFYQDHSCVVKAQSKPKYKSNWKSTAKLETRCSWSVSIQSMLEFLYFAKNRNNELVATLVETPIPTRASFSDLRL